MDDFVDIRSPDRPKSGPGNLPKTSLERAEALIDLMTRLADQVEDETRTLARPGASLAGVVKRKQPMSLVAEEMGRLLRVDRAGFAALPTETKARLREANTRLHDVTEINIRALQRSGEAQHRLVDLVVRSVNRDRAADHHAYAPNRGRKAPAVTRLALVPTTRGPATAGTLNTSI